MQYYEATQPSEMVLFTDNLQLTAVLYEILGGTDDSSLAGTRLQASTTNTSYQGILLMKAKAKLGVM